MSSPLSHGPWPTLFPPASIQSGTFAVCKDTSGLGWTHIPDLYLIWARAGVAVVPSNCQEVNLIAQCAELPPLAGVEQLNLVPAEVGCYEDVSSIEWGKYVWHKGGKWQTE